MRDDATTNNVVRLADWEWRRPHRPRSPFQRSLGSLEGGQRQSVLALLEAFGPLSDGFWPRNAPVWPERDEDEPALPPCGLPLAEFSDDALIAVCLEAGYSIGDQDTFKAVLPFFLAGAMARPLQTWILDPDLLQAKLETLDFEQWPAVERRVVAHALAVYAQHEIDLADLEPGDGDQALVATKRWAEHALAAAH